MKVTVDQDKVRLFRTVRAQRGRVFDQRDADGVVVLLNDDPPTDQADNVRRAVAACPAQAIAVEE